VLRERAARLVPALADAGGARSPGRAAAAPRRRRAVAWRAPRRGHGRSTATATGPRD
jgi:hypothetical protein